MTFPVVEATNESKTTTAGTAHTINLPSGIRARDVLVIVFSHAVACTLNAITGYTELVDTNAANAEKILYHDCDGSEGSTLAATTSASTKMSAVVYRISGAARPATRAPELSTVAAATSANPNATTCTPTGGAKDYLWLTFFTSAGEEADDDTWISVTPTGFSNTRMITSDTTGVASVNCSTASAEQQLNAASLDAAAWTQAQSLAWRAYTMAIHPASEVSPPFSRRFPRALLVR